MIEIVESSWVTKQITKLLNDEEYHLLQLTLLANPTAGVLIRSGKGLRKLRWGRKGSGKSGGVRVIYYYRTRQKRVEIVWIYAKSDQEDLAAGQLRELVKALGL